MRVLLLAVVMALLLGLLAAPAFAANPHQGGSTGQPGKECGTSGATSSPPGFGTQGFANAEGKYAGSQDQNNNNSKSVSQYDVACFQVT